MVNIQQDDLLRYLYNELSPEKRFQMEQLLAADPNLQERLQTLETAHNRLAKIDLISPDERTLEKIFQYAEKEEVIASGD